MKVRRPEVGLLVLSFALAFALMVVVHGERRVSATFTVPLEAPLPAAGEPALALPATLRISVTGPWARLRSLHASDLGPATIELSHPSPGVTSWSVRPESLHLPPGLGVEPLYPSQGTVQLTRDRP